MIKTCEPMIPIEFFFVDARYAVECADDEIVRDFPKGTALLLDNKALLLRGVYNGCGNYEIDLERKDYEFWATHLARKTWYHESIDLCLKLAYGILRNEQSDLEIIVAQLIDVIADGVNKAYLDYDEWCNVAVGVLKGIGAKRFAHDRRVNMAYKKAMRDFGEYEEQDND